jgi:hypothetical protein
MNPRQIKHNALRAVKGRTFSYDPAHIFNHYLRALVRLKKEERNDSKYKIQ